MRAKMDMSVSYLFINNLLDQLHDFFNRELKRDCV
jgi:hypothetical protein